ncbi:hypothetical protein [Sphingobacterium sp. LRF_L2]|uniref:hypothetical protein n=1 Tax=Sphingobacterium sp. LRF_L2 TaxID=3369421 RepID=UPI003F5F9446
MVDYQSTLERRLNPSPAVNQHANYVSPDLIKGSGAVSYNLPLFSLGLRDWDYTVGISYNSSHAVKVNEWGGRLGMSWQLSIGGVVSREIRGMPDEAASTRVSDDYNGLENDAPDMTDYDLVKKLSMGTIDGEYDLYNYNFFDASGSFIIKNGSAYFLKNDNKVKVDIDVPGYKFLITDKNGVKYYFKDTEIVKIHDQNECEVNSPYRYNTSPTSWFLSKVVTPSGEQLEYIYDPLDFDYTDNYTEFWTYFEYHDLMNYYSIFYPGMTASCSQPESGYKTSCFKFKQSYGRILRKIVSDKFEITFDYQDREDLMGEKLVKDIIFYKRFSSSLEELRRVSFSYTKFVSQAPMEAELLSKLQPDPVLHESLKTRYFLTAAYVHSNDAYYNYSFRYYTPELLPHRFSFSQDYFGCYNGAVNRGLIPEEALDVPNLPWMKTFAVNMPIANRDPNANGMSGLLSYVKHPTGGVDSISYENNEIRVRQIDEVRNKRIDWYTNEEDSYEGGLFDFNVPENGVGFLKFTLTYDEDAPMQGSTLESWATIKLMSTEGRIALPNGPSTVTLLLNGQYTSKYMGTGIRQVSTDLVFKKDVDYWVEVEIFGKDATLKMELDYLERIDTSYVDKKVDGFRVSQIQSYSSAGKLAKTKFFNYNVFKKIDDSLVYSDSSSIIRYNNPQYHSGWFSLCYEAVTDAFLNPHYSFYSLAQVANLYLRMYTLHSNPIQNPNIYGGLPYVYSNVSEFVHDFDKNVTSMDASIYDVSKNELAYRIFDYSTPDFPVNYSTVDNYAWGGGMELFNFQGKVVNVNGTLPISTRLNVEGIEAAIISHTQKKYSNTSRVLYNYSAFNHLPEVSISGVDAVQNLSKFIVRKFPIYSNDTKLDTVIKTDYFRSNTLLDSTKQKEWFGYNAKDKQLSQKSFRNSIGNLCKEEIYTPQRMVDENLDPDGVYNNMVQLHLITDIRKFLYTDNLLTSYIKVPYKRLSSVLFRPDQIEIGARGSSGEITQTFNSYDAYGNPLEITNKDGKHTVFLWGYGGQYPIAKIENATYQEVLSVLGQSVVTSFDSQLVTDSTILTNLQRLRNNANMRKTQITGYTYKTSTGMTSMTDPRGITEYYEYDGFQRLRDVLDMDGYLLKYYQYNYRP